MFCRDCVCVSCRMSFDEFIQALGDIAVRKYGRSLSPADAFKELFVRVRQWPGLVSLVCFRPTHCDRVVFAAPTFKHPQHMLPLKERFGGVIPVAGVAAAVSGDGGRASFLDRLCDPDVVRAWLPAVMPRKL